MSHRASTLVLATAVLATVLAGGCGDPAPSPSRPTVATAAPSPVGSASAGPTEASSGDPSAAILVDATLLDALPARVAGIDRAADAETAAEIATDPGLAEDLEALAVALYAGADDYAVATVVRPRAGVIGDEWFRDWRDTFDAAVCEQAGGVDPGRSEFEVDGRPVHRSTCTGGVVIHHVLLTGPDRVISIQGAGPTDFGRAIVDDLTE